MDKYIVKARVVFDVLEVIKYDSDQEDDYYRVETFQSEGDEKNMRWAIAYAKELNSKEEVINDNAK